MGYGSQRIWHEGEGIRFSPCRPVYSDIPNRSLGFKGNEFLKSFCGRGVVCRRVAPIPSRILAASRCRLNRPTTATMECSRCLGFNSTYCSSYRFVAPSGWGVWRMCCAYDHRVPLRNCGLWRVVQLGNPEPWAPARKVLPYIKLVWRWGSGTGCRGVVPGKPSFPCMAPLHHFSSRASVHRHPAQLTGTRPDPEFQTDTAVTS